MMLLSYISFGYLIVALVNPVFSAPTSSDGNDNNMEFQGTRSWFRKPDGTYDFDKNVEQAKEKYGQLADTLQELCDSLGLKTCQPFIAKLREDLNGSVLSVAEAIRYIDGHILETRKKAAVAAAERAAKEEQDS